MGHGMGMRMGSLAGYNVLYIGVHVTLLMNGDGESRGGERLGTWYIYIEGRVASDMYVLVHTYNTERASERSRDGFPGPGPPKMR